MAEPTHVLPVPSIINQVDYVSAAEEAITVQIVVGKNAFSFSTDEAESYLSSNIGLTAAKVAVTSAEELVVVAPSTFFLFDITFVNVNEAYRQIDVTETQTYIFSRIKEEFMMKNVMTAAGLIIFLPIYWTLIAFSMLSRLRIPKATNVMLVPPVHDRQAITGMSRDDCSPRFFDDFHKAAGNLGMKEFFINASQRFNGQVSHDPQPLPPYASAADNPAQFTSYNIVLFGLEDYVRALIFDRVDLSYPSFGEAFELLRALSTVALPLDEVAMLKRLRSELKIEDAIDRARVKVPTLTPLFRFDELQGLVPAIDEHIRDQVHSVLSSFTVREDAYYAKTIIDTSMAFLSRTRTPLNDRLQPKLTIGTLNQLVAQLLDVNLNPTQYTLEIESPHTDAFAMIMLIVTVYIFGAYFFSPTTRFYILNTIAYIMLSNGLMSPLNELNTISQIQTGGQNVFALYMQNQNEQSQEFITWFNAWTQQRANLDNPNYTDSYFGNGNPATEPLAGPLPIGANDELNYNRPVSSTYGDIPAYQNQANGFIEMMDALRNLVLNNNQPLKYRTELETLITTLKGKSQNLYMMLRDVMGQTIIPMARTPYGMFGQQVIQTTRRVHQINTDALISAILHNTETNFPIIEIASQQDFAILSLKIVYSFVRQVKDELLEGTKFRIVLDAFYDVLKKKFPQITDTLKHVLESKGERRKVQTPLAALPLPDPYNTIYQQTFELSEMLNGMPSQFGLADHFYIVRVPFNYSQTTANNDVYVQNSFNEAQMNILGTYTLQDIYLYMNRPYQTEDSNFVTPDWSWWDHILQQLRNMNTATATEIFSGLAPVHAIRINHQAIVDQTITQISHYDEDMRSKSVEYSFRPLSGGKVDVDNDVLAKAYLGNNPIKVNEFIGFLDYRERIATNLLTPLFNSQSFYFVVPRDDARMTFYTAQALAEQTTEIITRFDPYQISNKLPVEYAAVAFGSEPNLNPLF